VTWAQGTDGDETEVTEDIILVTADYVRYLSRETDGGWVVEQEEAYADDEEFERVMEDVHDYAVAYSEAKAEMQIENFFGE
jgi:phage repressor protein C with HTH and peptisase S24 domain